MNLSDTFYVALCMTVLILGVVYWFWTQNQYIQRKLNLLENIVYEMKTSLNTAGGIDSVLAAAGTGLECPAPAPAHNAEKETYAAPPSMDGLDADDFETEAALEELRAAAPAPAQPEMKFHMESVPEETVGSEGLQPGGILDVPETNKATLLDSMTLKELKNLAEQKGISGAKGMRKQELIDAIRSSKTSVTPFEVAEGGATLKLS